MGSITDAAASKIPIVDLSPFTNPSDNDTVTQAARLETASALVSACRDVGFVYVSNHGVPQADLDRAFALSKAFYDLPTEEKMKAPHPPGWSVHRGYSWPGLEKVSGAISEKDDEEFVKKLREVQDYKESYEIGSDSNADQPNIWPPSSVPLPSDWQPFMTSFYWTCFRAASNILRALALGIGLRDETHLLNLHSGHYNQLRLLHYPPIPAGALTAAYSGEGGDGSGGVPKFARMPAHTDWSTMTMLFQDDCGGLQVEDPSRAGEFVDVPPVAGTVVVNVGDLLMRWSNDYLKSTSHRVQLPPLEDRFTGPDRMTRARYSIPYFLTTDPDLVIECLRVDDDDQMPPKYEPITQRDYAAMRARMQY